MDFSIDKQPVFLVMNNDTLLHREVGVDKNLSCYFKGIWKNCSVQEPTTLCGRFQQDGVTPLDSFLMRILENA